MLQPGDLAPLEAVVWLGPNERMTFAEILEPGPILLLYYLFDWTST
jgi:hypothetical protein